MHKDKEQLKKYNKDYSANPIRVSELALDTLYNDIQWHKHWNYFLEQMAYDADKPSFDQAYAHLQALSKEIFGAIKA